MKQLLAAIATFALVLLTAFQGRAQYTGKGSHAERTTVKYVLDNAYKLDKSDVHVKLSGYIIEQIDSDTYWFSDTTGRIQIEVEKKRLPTTPFNETTKLIITGKVDRDLLEETEIEVKDIVFITQE